MFLQFISVARCDSGNLLRFLNSAHQNYIEMSICNKGQKKKIFLLACVIFEDEIGKAFMMLALDFGTNNLQT